jgi:hypothetical protein
MGNGMKENEKMASINQSSWENELDMLGTNSDISEYVRMLDKAPPVSRSLKALTDFVHGELC